MQLVSKHLTKHCLVFCAMFNQFSLFFMIFHPDRRTGASWHSDPDLDPKNRTPDLKMLYLYDQEELGDHPVHAYIIRVL